MALPESHPLDPDPDEVFGGHYLLFKRLERDALGDVYRAGRLGESGVDRVVSLRLFNGSEVDGERFWRACRERLPLWTTLRDRTSSPIVEAGFEDGVPFVALEHIFGRTLGELLARARERSHRVPLEDTLYLMDQIALGLRNAYDIRLEGERVVHGFLTPEFVHVSSEGEVRLSGFESSGGLLDLATDGPARSALAGYLSPEVNAAEPAQASDDVYTLGAIFGELLTGEQLPPFDADGTSRWVEAAALAAEAFPLPDPVRQLLGESLLPRDQRIQDVERWHEALRAIATAGDTKATAFSIAYLMNTLFGDELDQEVLLVETEKQAGEPVPVEEPAPEPELQPEPSAPPTASPQEGSKSAGDAGTGRLWIAIAVAVVLLGGLAVAHFVFEVPIPGVGSAKAKPLQVAAAAPKPDDLRARVVAEETEPEEVVALGTPVDEAPPYPEDLERVRSLVEQRAGELETTLRAQYDDRLVELRAQVEQARRAEATAPAETGDRPADAATRESIEPQVEPQVERPDPDAVSRQPESEPAPAVASSALTPEAGAPSQSPDELPTRVSAQWQNPAPAVEIAEPAQPEPEPTVVAAPEPVEPGSIVIGGPGVTPPKLLRQPTVIYPPAASRLNRQATVRVRVLVDETGRVNQVEQITEKVGLGFDQAALQAARTTRWTPPEKDGVKVKMWVGLSLNFRP